MTSALEPEVNLLKLKSFFDEAIEKGCEAVFLPEVFFSKGMGTSQTPFIVSYENEHYQSLLNLFENYDFFILGGSCAFEDNGRVYNRSLNFNPETDLIATYDKIHLFSCDVMSGEKRLKFNESSLYKKGEIPKIVKAGEMRLGLSICFDIRFPDLYQEYKINGANALSISSAFTVPTGKAHWHTLVRARAIENQCFVFASCQWGEHNENMYSYGHSLIVNPWGEVLADAGEGEKLLVQDIDFSECEVIRQKVKMK